MGFRQQNPIERSEIGIYCPRCEASQPPPNFLIFSCIDNDFDNDNNNDINNDFSPPDDSIEDGTEDANHNGRIDGDNGDGTKTNTEAWDETSPNLADSDDDGFDDNDEWNWGMDPRTQDSDHDGIKDQDEDKDLDGNLDTGETDPTLFDTDGDGLSDKTEQDGWTVCIIKEATGEKVNHYTATSNPRTVHSDNDGLSDYEEFQNCTDPEKEDTDGDGLNDYIELNYNISSSPTGIDGVPPEITFFDSEYALRTETSGPLYNLKITSKYVVKVWISAGDIFGIDWVAVHLFGIGSDVYYANGQKNVTKQKFEFTLDVIQAVNSLFKNVGVNITARDVNDNYGFKDEEIPSWKERAFDALLGPLMQLAELLGEVFSAIYNWIVSAAEWTSNNVIEPVFDNIYKFIEKIVFSLVDIIEQVDNTLGGNFDLSIMLKVVFNFFIAAFGPIFNTINEIFEVFNCVINFLTKFTDYIFDLVEEGIKTIIDKVISFITDSDVDSPSLLSEIITALIFNRMSKFLTEKVVPFVADSTLNGFSIICRNIDNYINEVEDTKLAGDEPNTGEKDPWDQSNTGEKDEDNERYDGWFIDEIFKVLKNIGLPIMEDFLEAFITLSWIGAGISPFLAVYGLKGGASTAISLSSTRNDLHYKAFEEFATKDVWTKISNFNTKFDWHLILKWCSIPGVGLLLAFVGTLIKLVVEMIPGVPEYAENVCTFIGVLMAGVGLGFECIKLNKITTTGTLIIFLIEMAILRLEILIKVVEMYNIPGE